MSTPIKTYRSIRFRLTAWYAGTMLAIFAFTGVFLFLAVQNAAEKTLDTDLRARLAAVRENLPDDLSKEDPEHLGESLEAQAATGAAGVWLQVADNHGHWLHRSDAIKDGDQSPPSAVGLPRDGRTQTAIVRRTPFRILTAMANGGVVQLGMPIGQFTEMLKDLRWTLLIACPILLLLAGGGGYWMSGRALKPVDEIALAVEHIGSENLAERLRLRGTGDELDRLSGLINQMLSRLQSSFERVRQFTADASHELRTPVAIIRTTGEVMRISDGPVNEHHTEWTHVIGQTERMTALIDDLLLLARGDSGRLDLAFEAMDLAHTVKEAASEIRVLLETSGLRLTSSIPNGCPMRGCPEALKRVLLVLIDNAIKYSRAEGEITVGLHIAESSTTRSAIVEVRDTGIGIPAADLPHIFDRFYRVSSDRSRQSGGAGLGLSIAQSLAELHGGSIKAESQLGSGSVFRLVLPLA